MIFVLQLTSLDNVSTYSIKIITFPVLDTQSHRMGFDFCLLHHPPHPISSQELYTVWASSVHSDCCCSDEEISSLDNWNLEFFLLHFLLQNSMYSLLTFQSPTILTPKHLRITSDDLPKPDSSAQVVTSLHHFGHTLYVQNHYVLYSPIGNSALS